MNNFKALNSYILFLIMFTYACGNDNDVGKSPRSVDIQEQVSEGSYLAILRPLNNSLSGFLPTGGAEVEIQDETVQIKTYLDDDARVTHLQSIHTGQRCPTLSDDSNGDGLIDINEAYKAVGEVLIPLDADINSAVNAEGIYPLGGGYTYTAQASLANLENDVRQRVNQNLNLSGRVVLIHGVNGWTTLPDSVNTRNGMLKQASIPVACGILKRTN
jgi:hypothetical protein